jgi:hypothetical protein
LRSSNAHCRKTKECAASKITFFEHLVFSQWLTTPPVRGGPLVIVAARAGEKAPPD